MITITKPTLGIWLREQSTTAIPRNFDGVKCVKSKLRVYRGVWGRGYLLFTMFKPKMESFIQIHFT